MKNKGFTLIEVIASLAIIALAAALLAPMLMQQSDVFWSVSRYNSYDLAGNTAGEFISDQLYNAGSVSVSRDGGGGQHRLSVLGGKLILDGEDVFGEEFYDGALLKLSAAKPGFIGGSAEDGDTIIFQLELVRNDTVYFRRMFSVTSMLGRRGGTMEGGLSMIESPGLYIDYNEIH